MPEKARCKFRCTEVDGEHVKLEAQYDPDVEEDAAFSDATPHGFMEIVVENPALEGFFAEGQEYYLDVTPTA